MTIELARPIGARTDGQGEAMRTRTAAADDSARPARSIPTEADRSCHLPDPAGSAARVAGTSTGPLGPAAAAIYRFNASRQARLRRRLVEIVSTAKSAFSLALRRTTCLAGSRMMGPRR